MKLENFLNKYVVITKRDGKKVSGILIKIINDNNDEFDFVSLIVRVDNNKYKTVYLIEIESIGEII